MFIYNFKVNGGLLLKIIIVILSAFMLIVFGISMYRIFFSSGKFVVNDNIKAKDVTEIEAKQYTNTLQAVHQDIESYIGMKIKVAGYVYRLIDFKEEQFVIARDMLINEEKTQKLVVGFLCEYKKASEFEDGQWVTLTGEIQKGKYHEQEIPILKVLEIQKTDKPEDEFVSAPDDTYIPTSGLL